MIMPLNIYSNCYFLLNDLLSLYFCSSIGKHMNPLFFHLKTTDMVHKVSKPKAFNFVD